MRTKPDGSPRFVLALALALACQPPASDDASTGDADKNELDTSNSTDPDDDGYENDEDCAPNNERINPGAQELCDHVDNDCDGEVDEDVTESYFEDADGDSFGSSDSVEEACVKPSGYTTNSSDCDDSDDTIYPGSPEACDGVDNNCDGVVDEDCE